MILMMQSVSGTYLADRKDLFETYLAEQEKGTRTVAAAFVSKGQIAGYATLLHVSNHPGFKSRNIPEIADLNVIPAYRNNGIARRLLKRLETEAKRQGHTRIGIGVGLYADYGAAQRLYVKSGYVPDGAGLFYNNVPVEKGQRVAVNDSLAIYFIKRISK